ncbi:hypothetical protein BD324DRAFT_632157, partial [Kockovaella imperatae]
MLYSSSSPPRLSLSLTFHKSPNSIYPFPLLWSFSSASFFIRRRRRPPAALPLPCVLLASLCVLTSPLAPPPPF